VSAAPLLHHARSNERVSSGQPRPTRRRLPPFGQRDQAFALRQFPGSFARASDGFCLLAGFALGRFFVRVATLHFTKNGLALHLLFEGPKSLFDIEYPQNVSNRGGPEVSDSIKPGSNQARISGLYAVLARASIVPRDRARGPWLLFARSHTVESFERTPMALSFPNKSRAFDATRRAVRF